MNYEYNEGALLSSILYSDTIRKEHVDNIFAHVTNDMFLDKKARYTYGMIKELCEGDDIDLLGTNHLITKLRMMAQIEYKGLPEYIVSLSELWSPVGTIPHWIKKIQEAYFEERFKTAKSKEEFEQVISDQAKYKLEEEVVTLSSEASLVIDELDKLKDSVVFTPYESINAVIGSLQGGDMVVLAGATGGGKTCFMLNLITGMAKAGKKPLIFSLEMPKRQLQQRIICAETDIDAKKFRSFQVTLEERRRYKEYADNEFSKLNIDIYKKQVASIELIKSVVAKSDADIVFIDYLGLINSYTTKSTYDKFSDISREIKLMAMQYSKPVIALHQLNRCFQEREDKTPKTSDLRDSGKIEQDADMIWFVYRPFQFDPKADEADMRFIIAKNRFGESNKEIRLVFNGRHQRITEPMKV